MWRPPDPLDAVVVWRDQAEHAAESLTRGSRVVVLGRLQQRAWTAEDGSARSTVGAVAEELGRVSVGRRRPRPKRRGARTSSDFCSARRISRLRWATTTTRATRSV